MIGDRGVIELSRDKAKLEFDSIKKVKLDQAIFLDIRNSTCKIV